MSDIQTCIRCQRRYVGSGEFNVNPCRKCKGNMKQVIVINTSLNMSPGKLGAQIAHATLLAFIQNIEWDNGWNMEQSGWLEDGKPVIILAGKDETELFQLQEKAKQKGITNSLIRDAGRTELDPGSVTALAIGPDEDHPINQVTGHLKLL